MRAGRGGGNGIGDAGAKIDGFRRDGRAGLGPRALFATSIIVNAPFAVAKDGAVRRGEVGGGGPSGRALPDLALSVEGADDELPRAGTSPGGSLGGHPDRPFVGSLTPRTPRKRSDAAS